MKDQNHLQNHCGMEVPIASRTNPYSILQVRHDATTLEIRESYRRLALWYHPGRRKARDLPDGELQRRCAVFSTLAAAYETLIDNGTRQIYDALLRQEFDGGVWVSGKPWLLTYSGFSPLCTTLSDSDDTPALIHSQSSDSLTDTNCDPSLTLFVAARGGRPLSDPYAVFEFVFGSNPFDRVVLTGKVVGAGNALNVRPSTARVGSIRTLPNGSIHSTTSRVLQNRKLTRTEIITESPDGQRRVLVNVVGEDIITVNEAERQCSSCFSGFWEDTIDDCRKCFNECGNVFPVIKVP